jgi:hypothetical protein
VRPWAPFTRSQRRPPLGAALHTPPRVCQARRARSARDEPAIVRVRVTPALRMEELFETVAALAAEGRTLPSGMPRPLDLALFMREFEQEVAAPVAPAWSVR